jgi:hypothetical protein
MDAPRFLVAKYVPDVFRNEPRNIGIILWAPEITLARFAGERIDSPGKVDDQDIPSFVASPEAYRQWVRYWRREVTKPVIRPATGGPGVPRTSPACLDALRQTGPGNFLLCDGGTFGDPIPISEIPAVADRLFAECVGTDRIGPPLAARTSKVGPQVPDSDRPNLPIDLQEMRERAWLGF